MLLSLKIEREIAKSSSLNLFIFMQDAPTINCTASPRWPFEACDEDKTVLSYACATQNLRTVEYLLEHGARVDLDHPLHFFRKILTGMTMHDELIETYSMARLLINRGSVMDLTRPTGLQNYGVSLGHFECCKLRSLYWNRAVYHHADSS